MMCSRGVKVWPDGFSETFCVDAFRCRFQGPDGVVVSPYQVTALLDRVAGLGVTVVKTEYLRTFDGKAGFTLAQGQ
jgi:isocitrate dehydrogenase